MEILLQLGRSQNCSAQPVRSGDVYTGIWEVFLYRNDRSSVDEHWLLVSEKVGITNRQMGAGDCFSEPWFG
jgi:hypothetical protein